MLYRLIPTEWSGSVAPLEGNFDSTYVEAKNKEGYNCYFFPNNSSYYVPEKGKYLSGDMVDRFDYVFVDMDMKDGAYASKESFIEKLNAFDLKPTSIIDSGNGIHAYWKLKGLDATSYLRLQRRLCRYFSTDEAVSKLCQLMRVPNTLNVKDVNNFKPCIVLQSNDNVYSASKMDEALPLLLQADEDYCTAHYNSTFKIQEKDINISEVLPAKFTQLLRSNSEVKKLFSGSNNDRSKSDYRLGHILFANGYTKEEMRDVLYHTAKATTRAPIHRFNYANNIVDKIHTYESTPKSVLLPEYVKDILSAVQKTTGERLKGHSMFDATHIGFRLGHVAGLVGGSGVGKTSLTLNLFKSFAENHPEYVHVFVSLEQPKNEIASKWSLMCGSNKNLNDKVLILSNVDTQGQYRKLSIWDIEESIKALEKESGKKVGCVVIDHIAILAHESREGKKQELLDTCNDMKAFALSTNTFLIMLSQTTKGKAGAGDIELDKDAAYGTVFFESYCDWLVTLWQPLKRVYGEAPHMTVCAYKFCKIRHKNVLRDRILEDTVYIAMFDPETENLREVTPTEMESYEFWNKEATKIRNKDKKTDTAIVHSLNGINDNNGRTTTGTV